MKTLIFQLVLLVSLSAMANTPFVQKKHTVTKHISKSFTVHEASSFFASNKYGTITIVTDETNKNNIKIDINIKVSSDNQSDAEEQLKQISANISQNGTSVSAKTLIENNSTSFLKSFWKTNRSVSIRIDYIVFLPTKTKISLENEYGDIFLNRTDNNLKTTVKYGSVNIEQVNADASLHLEYSPNSILKSAKNVYITGTYSGISVEKAEYMKASIDYTGLKIKSVGKLNAACKYGSLSVDSVKELFVESDYTSVKVGNVNLQGKISSEYGNVHIQEIGADVSSLDIQGEFCTITTKYHKNWDFSYEFSNSFSKTEIPNNLPYNKKNIGNMESYISGTKGKGKNTYKISSKFGKVKVEEI